MKEFTLTSPFTGENIPVTVNIRKYNNGRPAIELLEMDPEYGYTPYATASVNLPDVLLQPNEVLIKDYAENEGITKFLSKHNIVVPTNNWVRSGYVDIQVCILNPESEWGAIPSVYSLDEEPEYDTVSDKTPLVASYVNVENVTNTPNSNGWVSMNNKMDPSPEEIDIETGKCLWTINGYRIWADSYKQALELLPMIESF